ncbi:MAG: TrkH family potassium uptake protein [Acholeplasmatales bacterium]|nr:TrkH family potassium uptake protein [Acholeplasmatales bacterium]
MNYGIIRNVLGKIMIMMACIMSVSLIFCVAYQESFKCYLAFLVPVGILLVLGWLLNIKKAKSKKMLAREGFVIVGLTWILMAAFGGIPFLIDGCMDNFFDAFFEMSSGFTTSGGSIFKGTEMEEITHSLKFWRSFTHWIGGMGILVFVLAFIPESDDGSAMHILRAESPGPQVGKLVSKMKATSRILYLIYFVLTIICILFLWIGPDKRMNFFNSLVYSLGTAGTGGFSIHSIGVAYFNAYSQYVIAIFMLIFAVNFSIYYLLLIKNVKEVWQNGELKWYICIVTIAVTIIAINIFHMVSEITTVEEAFRHSLFQVASIISTTGYSTMNFDLWPNLAKFTLLIVMAIGGCAGSTAGGLKVCRVQILFKSSIKKVKNMVNPRKVEALYIDGKPMNDATLEGVHSYFAVYAIVFVLATLLISVDNFDLVTNISASLTCISNVGPGLGAVGPYGTFYYYSDFSKFVLSIEMIAGRLEFFPLLVLFTPSTWKRKI